MPQPVSERPVYRNGVYPHSSFRTHHRVQVMDLGGGLVVVLFIAAMAAIAIALLLGAFWMIRTFWEMLVRS